MKYITDPLYGDIILNDVEAKLVADPIVQRLRNIKQLGFVDMVYPTAVHTRFSHALGVAHLVKRIGDILNIDPVMVQMLRFAALVHDVGHGPYSHKSETLLENYTELTHEKISAKLIKTKLSPIIAEAGIDSRVIAKIVTGEGGPYQELLRGYFDVDYLDALARDAYFTGLPFGRTDTSRLLNSIAFTEEGKLCIKFKGKSALEAFFVGKHLMYASAYQHHVESIASKMFRKALEDAIIRKKIDPLEAWRMDDSQLRCALENSNGISKKLMERLNQRNLYKRFIYLKKDELKEDTFKTLIGMRKDPEMMMQLESEIANVLGQDYGEVLVEIREPMERPISEGEVGLCFLMKDGSLKPVVDVSRLIKSLKDAQWDTWRFGVYVPESKLECDKEKAMKVLNEFSTVKLDKFIDES